MHNTILSIMICLIQSRVVKEKELTFYCTRSFHTLDTFFDNITSTNIAFIDNGSPVIFNDQPMSAPQVVIRFTLQSWCRTWTTCHQITSTNTPSLCQHFKNIWPRVFNLYVRIKSTHGKTLPFRKNICLIGGTNRSSRRITHCCGTNINSEITLRD